MHVIDLFNNNDQKFLEGMINNEADIIKFPGKMNVRSINPKNPTDGEVVSLKTGPRKQTLSTKDLAMISDRALDKEYGYGLSVPGPNFGWLANMNSAMFAKRAIDSGETNLEKIAAEVHKGWAAAAIGDYKNKLPIDPPTPHEAKLRRLRLAQVEYGNLPEKEKEKDRVVARALLQAISGREVPSTDMSEGDVVPMPVRTPTNPVVNVQPASVLPFSQFRDPGTRNLERWKQRVKDHHPEYGNKIRFVSKDNGKVISAEMPGLDRSFGVFDLATEKGQVLDEGGVAGPKNCWPGHRKVGTQPGTGKNAGKRVNKCEKIKEQGVADGSEQPVSFREMVNVVDEHYPKYYAELSGSDISDKQFERAIVNAYKAIVKKQGVAEDQINESPTIDFIRELISEFNKQMSGSPYYPMDYKNPGMRMWTRGDGSKYKDPGYIFIDRDLKPEDQPKWQKAGAVEKFWKFLESKGARKIGDVSGEFGSDPHSPAIVLNKLIFVFNGRSIAWGSTSRLKNSNVWRQKQQGVAEGSETEGTATLAKIAAAGDNGYDMIEDGLNGLLGTEAQIMLQDMYDDVSREHRLHPDDDFEQIYDRMMDRIESDYGQQGVEEVQEPKLSDYHQKRVLKNPNKPLPHNREPKLSDYKQTLVPKNPKKKGVEEGVAETLPMDDAKKILSHYGADHFKTTSNELHFYKNGRPFSVDLILGSDAVRSVSLSQLNSATRQLKGQGIAEGDGNPDIRPGMKVSQGTVVKVQGNTVVVKAPNGELTTMNIHDVGQSVAEGAEDNPVVNAIIRRILNQRPDLLKYGADLVGDAVDEVASFVGQVDEIGTSDVSAWVKQVEDYVKNAAGGIGRLNEVSDEMLINYLTKVHQDAMKHPADPSKRSPEKRNKSVAGFNRAFNKLDARPRKDAADEIDQAQALAPRVSEVSDVKDLEKMNHEDYIKQADELHAKMMAASQRNDMSAYEKLKIERDELDARARKGLKENEKEGNPRIRKYSKLRPDGSKAVRYEVLDYRGMRIPGQGVEGFDDLKYAKEFFHRNYDKLQDPMSEQIHEEPIREVAGRYWCKNEKRWKNVE